MGGRTLPRKTTLRKSVLTLIVTGVIFSGGMYGAEDVTAQTKPVSVSGAISANTFGYRVSGIEPRRPSFSWLVSGNFTLLVYKFILPFAFSFSEQERNFRQPFNQLGLSPSWRWITVHAGYRSLTFSPYTLAGYTFVGGGLELNPGILRTGFIYGRFQRAVEEDTTNPEKDTPSFSRYGYSAKLGLGKQNQYVDLIFLRAWDDTNSLRSDPVNEGVFPAENVCVGLSAKYSLFGVLAFDFDLGVSDYTRDLRAEKLPESGNSLVEAFRPVLDPRISTQIYLAGQAGVNLQLRNFFLQVQYKRIDPDYKSMGAYFSENDINGFSISSSWQLFKQKLRLTGSGGIQQDNLTRRKLATTRRGRASFVVSVNPEPWFGLDALYSNFDTRQQPGLAPLNDSLKLDQVNHQVGVTPRVSWTTGGMSHSVMVMATFQALNDHNPETRSRNATNSQNINLSYQLSVTPLALTFSPALTYTQLNAFGSVSRVRGFSLGVNQLFFNNNLSINLSSSYAGNETDGSLTSTTLSSWVMLTYRLQTRHSFNGQLTYTGNFARAVSAQSFSEVQGGIGYAFTF